MYTSLLTNVENNILTITINRPDKLNALNATVINELGDTINQFKSNTTLKAAIITGSGLKAFVAGADISEFTTANAAEGKALAIHGHTTLFNNIENCPKPIIAAVNGFALGGGCELAMACHMRIASDNAKFGQPEVNLGLIPGYGGTQRLIQLIGKGKAIELMLTANLIDANEAKNLGLVNHVTTSENLLTETTNMLQLIISKGPNAVAKVLAAVNAYFNKSLNGFEAEIDLFSQCFATDEMKEGVGSFLEKRKPNFN